MFRESAPLTSACVLRVVVVVISAVDTVWFSVSHGQVMSYTEMYPLFERLVIIYLMEESDSEVPTREPSLILSLDLQLG